MNGLRLKAMGSLVATILLAGATASVTAPDSPVADAAREGDVESLFQELQKALSEAHSWEEIGQRSREHVTQRFDARVQGARLAEVYRGLVRGGPN